MSLMWTRYRRAQGAAPCNFASALLGVGGSLETETSVPKPLELTRNKLGTFSKHQPEHFWNIVGTSSETEICHICRSDQWDALTDVISMDKSSGISRASTQQPPTSRCLTPAQASSSSSSRFNTRPNKSILIKFSMRRHHFADGYHVHDYGWWTSYF